MQRVCWILLVVLLNDKKVLIYKSESKGLVEFKI